MIYLIRSYQHLLLYKNQSWKIYIKLIFKLDIAIKNIKISFLAFLIYKQVFKHYINKILGKKLDIFVFTYLNNIFIYTKNLMQDYVITIL